MARTWGTIASATDEYADQGQRDPWDRVLLYGVELPGRAEVEVSGGIGNEVDLKKSKGSDGATITDLGREPAKITIRVSVWTQSQVETWEEMARTLMPPPKKNGIRGFSIDHPSLDPFGIRLVAVTHITPLRKSGAEGEKSAELHCIEYIPSMVRDATKTLDGGDFQVSQAARATANGKGQYTPDALRENVSTGAFQVAEAERPSATESKP